MNETSVGREKNLKPLFQFLCAFTTTAHIYSEQGKSLLIVYHPTEIYLYFAPLSFCACSPSEENTRPRVRPTNFHGIYTESFRSHFVLMVRLYETGRNGMNDVEGLYIVLFFIHIFHLTYKVVFCIRSAEKKKSWREMAHFNLKGEERKKKILWNGLKRKARREKGK